MRQDGSCSASRVFCLGALDKCMQSGDYSSDNPNAYYERYSQPDAYRSSNLSACNKQAQRIIENRKPVFALAACAGCYVYIATGFKDPPRIMAMVKCL